MRGIAVCVAASLAFGQSRTLPPKDESGRDPQFAAFFTQFRAAVRRKDAAALVRMLSPGIQNTFGTGGQGAEEFQRIWEIEKPGSPVFDVLDKLLALGGVLSSPDTYCAPSIAILFPDDLDRYEHLVVAGTKVRLRSNASTDAAIVARLNNEIVRLVESGPQWTQVRTFSGLTGFIANEYVYSPVGYRACFARSSSGEWRLSVLVAGD